MGHRGNPGRIELQYDSFEATNNPSSLLGEKWSNPQEVRVAIRAVGDNNR